MLRSLLALSALSLVAAPATAATYSAKLVTPTSDRIIGRDISWNCGPAACQGGQRKAGRWYSAKASPRRPAESTAFSSTGVR